MVKYPTLWSYGIPRGSINDRGSNILLRISANGKTHCFSYVISSYPSKEACIKHVEKIREEKSRELGVTRNEIQFVDKNTIKIKLTRDYTFITDASNLHLINQFPLQTKVKKEKGVNRMYVYGQDKKRAFPFTDLLGDFKIVEYVNGNTLDLRKANIKEFGLGFTTAKTNDEINELVIEDFSQYYDVPINNLPKNKWILGHVPGTIFFRNENKGKILTMTINDKKLKKAHAKTFNVAEYKSVDDTIKQAKIYMINACHKLGLVKNQIRIHDDYFEIMVTKNIIVKTDLVFLPLFMPTFDKLKLNITVCKAYTGSYNKKYVAINSKYYDKPISFHKFIMGSPMIDHINGDSLDNRLCNLRFTDYYHNNNNRVSISDLEYGVKHGSNNKGEYYTASLSEGFGKKYFYIPEYGVCAKNLANWYRKNILEISFTAESIEKFPFDADDVYTIKEIIKEIEKYKNDTITRVVLDPDKYLYCYDKLDYQLKKKMHQKYILEQLWRIIQLDIKISKLNAVINKFKIKSTNKLINV